jgi:hypothetical protein
MKLLLFLTALFVAGGLLLSNLRKPERDLLKKIEAQQIVLDKKLECLVSMQWKQDENALKIYSGMEPDWQGRTYPDVPECEGVL